MGIPSFSKVLVNSPAFNVSIAQSGSEFKLVATVGASAGGGDVAGFAAVKGSIEADLEEQVLVDAGLGVIEAKFAGNAAIQTGLKELQALIDVELAASAAAAAPAST